MSKPDASWRTYRLPMLVDSDFGPLPFRHFHSCKPGDPRELHCRGFGVRECHDAECGRIRPMPKSRSDKPIGLCDGLECGEPLPANDKGLLYLGKKGRYCTPECREANEGGAYGPRQKREPSPKGSSQAARFQFRTLR